MIFTIWNGESYHTATELATVTQGSASSLQNYEDYD